MSKKVILSVLLSGLYCVVSAQMTITRTVVTVLEKYENKWQHWGGDVETIRFAAVKQVTGSDSSVTMQIRVTNKDWEKTSMTTGIAISGNNWAVGGSSTELLKRRVGLIVLTKAEVQALYDFENEMFVKSNNGESPNLETTWSINFGGRFIASASYVGKWKHSWIIDDASFEIPDTEVIPMFRKLKLILGLM